MYSLFFNRLIKLSVLNIAGFVLLICHLFFMPSLCAAEEIIFVNGDRVTGDIVSLKGGTFEVEAGFGRIFLPKSSIQRIEFNSYSIGAPSGISIIKPDDLISYIQNSKLSFYIDNEKISANNFANQIRLRWAMKLAHIKELDEFREKLISYSPKTGAHNLVEISKGKKIKVCDWLDSVLKSTRRDIKAAAGADDKSKGGVSNDGNDAENSDKNFKRK